MAYQNVGKCRIFVDYFQYANAIGLIGYWNNTDTRFSPQNASIFMNPLSPATCSQFPVNSSTQYYTFDFSSPIWGMNYYGMLGHNLGGVPMTVTYSYSGVNVAGNDIWLSNGTEEIINAQINTPASSSTRNITPVYNGFSLWKFNEIVADDAYATLVNPGTDANPVPDGTMQDVQLRDVFGYQSSITFPPPIEGTDGVYTLGYSPTCGRIYEFEHAPDMKLTMERQFDGVKRQKTGGGADISNTTYLGPPNWSLSGNPWTLTEANPGFISEPIAGARMGRRIWKLKFSMMSDRVSSSSTSGGIMPLNEMATPYGVDTSTGAGYTENTDVVDGEWESDGTQDVFKSDFWSDDSFIGLVYGKTMGFTLPIIFQSDSNDNSPQNFAICKIDNKSLKITQTSLKKYDIQLTIREVW